MFNPLSAPLWKIATVGAGVVSLVLTALLMSSFFENRDLTKQRAVLTAAINDPQTGYIVRLAQAATNVETLRTALNTQKLSFQKESEKQNEALKASEARLALAQAATSAMELKLHRFLATKPQGATLEDRVRDIDHRALSELVQ